LADQRAIIYLIQDIQGLGAQLAQQPANQPASLGDELTSLFLQIEAFNAETQAPVELHVSGAESLTRTSRGEQTALLEDLVETLRARSSAIEVRLSELEPEILERQEELQRIDTEERRLRREQDLAEETNVGLLRKLEEARIAAQEENRVFQVGSYAAVSTSPSGSRGITNTLVAGLVGGVIGLGAVFAWKWWSEGAEEQDHSGAE
jgi:uncharacterized protein involved in exopolysaccharide biosynthesis